MKKEKKEFSEFPNVISVRTALKEGNRNTRISALIMGFGNLAGGQIVKGLMYLLMEIAFIFYMVMFGGGFLGGLVTLGTRTTEEVFNEEKQIYEYAAGDNSMLFLLYGIITLFLIAAFIFAWRTAVKSAYQVQKLKEAGREIPGIREDLKKLIDGRLYGTLLVMPVMCVVVFTIMPLVFMTCMAFTNYDRNHQPPGALFDWVGLINFQKLFDLSGSLGYAFWHVLGWTIIWAILATALNYILGMILAIVINRKETHWKGFWRFIFVLSIAVPQFVSLLIMRTMLQEQGAINILLQNLGLISAPLPFWTNTMWARVTVIIVNLWVGIPFTLLQVTGILQNIPQELYESAKVDGANAVVTFFKITLPYMLFVTTPYLITQFIGNINNFNVIYLLTEGKPAAMDYFNGTAGKTDLLVTWLYKLTVDFKDYNYAAVIGITVFVLSAVFSLAAYQHTGSYKDEEGFQ
ncbi:MAG: sugar ABC transporter permease [Lachnospiraceae bacterium]|nr:sugar ABC transporter permease [Lachnospiraceae bacterium]